MVLSFAKKQLEKLSQKLHEPVFYSQDSQSSNPLSFKHRETFGEQYPDDVLNKFYQILSTSENVVNLYAFTNSQREIDFGYQLTGIQDGYLVISKRSKSTSYTKTLNSKNVTYTEYKVSPWVFLKDNYTSIIEKDPSLVLDVLKNIQNSDKSEFMNGITEEIKQNLFSKFTAAGSLYDRLVSITSNGGSVIEIIGGFTETYHNRNKHYRSLLDLKKDTNLIFKTVQKTRDEFLNIIGRNSILNEIKDTIWYTQEQCANAINSLLNPDFTNYKTEQSNQQAAESLPEVQAEVVLSSAYEFPEVPVEPLSNDDEEIPEVPVFDPEDTEPQSANDDIELSEPPVTKEAQSISAFLSIDPEELEGSPQVRFFRYAEAEDQKIRAKELAIEKEKSLSPITRFFADVSDDEINPDKLFASITTSNPVQTSELNIFSEDIFSLEGPGIYSALNPYQEIQSTLNQSLNLNPFQPYKTIPSLSEDTTESKPFVPPVLNLNPDKNIQEPIHTTKESSPFSRFADRINAGLKDLTGKVTRAKKGLSTLFKF